jgi:hypothetical protein
MKNTTNTTDWKTCPLSPVERVKLMPVCRELGIGMDHYRSDQALCEAIEAAVLQEVAAMDTPERGFYEI